MKKLLTVILFALLLTGCLQSAPAATSLPASTLAENIFTTPATAEAPGFSDLDETPPKPASKVDPGNVGSSSFGMLKNDLNFSEELGKYIIYQGGELHLRLQFSFDGTVGNEGVGAMILLDGIPQPYKTADNQEYAYIHTFYPPFENGGYILAEVIFVPVCGKSGDRLNLSMFTVLEPDYSVTSTPSIPFRLTSSHMDFTATLIMQADPETGPLPAVTERILSLSISQQDLTSQDTQGWSAEDLQSKYSFLHGFPNPVPGGMVYQMGSEAMLNVHAEIFSPGFVEWSLVVYIDNKPVSVLKSNDIRFSVPAGKKIIIDMDLCMEGTDGEMPLYMALVVRNAHTPQLQLANCWMDVTRPYYLLSAGDFEEWARLAGIA